jgi:hypothetical protein
MQCNVKYKKALLKPKKNKNMSITEKYKVQSIDSFYCKEWLLKKHYAKRIPAIEYSFGLYLENVIMGVCTFGPPPRVMNDGECIFNDYKVKTLELNRLVVKDGLEKNTLSFFVSQCIKMLPTPLCLVSYADYTFGHTGYIYQATNWIYAGLNQIHERQIFYDGKEIHPRTACSMGFTSISDWAAKDPKVKLGEYTKKHRYFKFMGTKKEIKTMKQKFVYEIKEYPKGDNKKYDSSNAVTVQLGMF